jgi:allantoinase
VAKCAPPVRADAERARLWQLVKTGAVDMLTSDHSPSSPDLKAGSFADAWGGIASCQTTRTLLLSEREGLALEQVARLTGGAAAQRFRLPRKGRVTIGADADLALVDLDTEYELAAGELEYRHRLSPWIGRRLRARVTRTLLRGAEAWPEAKAAPRLLTPSL